MIEDAQLRLPLNDHILYTEALLKKLKPGQSLRIVTAPGYVEPKQWLGVRGTPTAPGLSFITWLTEEEADDLVKCFRGSIEWL